MLRNLAVLSGSVVLSILLLEILLRVGHLYIPPPDKPSCVYAGPNCDLYEANDALGYRLKPSRITTYRYPLLASFGRTLSMNSNRHGFRDSREFEEPDPRFRILVTGDSQAFGEGVEEKERFSDVLEALEPAWRVDNIALPGFGLDLMLRAFETAGVAAKPNALVLSVFADDFNRVAPYYAAIGYHPPRFTLAGDQLVSIPYPELTPWTRTHLSQAAQALTYKFSQKERRLNQAILDRFRELSHTLNFRLFVVLVPIPGPSSEQQAGMRWLAGYCRTKNIPYRDLTDLFPPREFDHFMIVKNSHFNPEGHALIAKALRDFMKQGLASK